MKTIGILNGPNLNFLGKRQTDIYGTQSLDDLKFNLTQEAKKLNLLLLFEQSNHEGVLIDTLQDWHEKVEGVIFNPGGLTHSSISLGDTISSVSFPVIEVHISNIYAREGFRAQSFISPVSLGVISGLGLEGYTLALRCLSSIIKKRKADV